MTRPAAALDVERVRAGVDAALAAHVSTLSDELASIAADSAPLVDAVRVMLAGGKRLRAAFCYWSWRAHGGGEAMHSTAQEERDGLAARDEVLRVGAALELFQAAALFHDDVMDDSDTRRGHRAAHHEFAAVHEEQSWSGSARRFGESAAILLGDLTLIASEREFSAAVRTLGPATRLRAQETYDSMRTEVTVGQYLDVVAQALPWGTDARADEARARAVIRSKSARYSVEHPIVLGAVLAGASDDQIDQCRRIGLPLGEAFQLRDDVLGVFGDPSTTGKPAGDDLREGKRTVLVARALEHSDGADRDLLLASLGNRLLEAQEIESLRAAIARSGAVAQVEGLIRELSQPALESLRLTDLLEPGRSMLAELGEAAIVRES